MSLLAMLESLKFTEPNQLKLTITSELENLSFDQRSEVLEVYRSKDAIVRVVASILNAVFTQKKNDVSLVEANLHGTFE